MIERTFDESIGIVRVRVSGAWNPSEIDDHYARLRILLDTLRARSIAIRILVDVRDAPPRPPAIEAQIAAKKDIYRPGDRIAILVGGQEDKDHVRTLQHRAGKWAWQNELAAEQWLLIGDDAQPS